MPSLVTHQLCAYEALNRSKPTALLSIVDAYPEAFSIGSSGPDFLFFYQFWPFFTSSKTKQINELGNLIHHSHINDVFAKALALTKQNIVHREETISYMAGWLTHYALDRNAHPFIFYWSGFGSKKADYHHRRMEAMIDSLMIRRKLGRDIATYCPADVVLRGRHTHQAIHSLYGPLAKQIFDVNLSSQDILVCLQDMRRLYQILHDPQGWKFPLLQSLEQTPYAFTGTLIKRYYNDKDKQYDVLNETHQTWFHPCDDTIQSQASFISLYEQGVEEASQLLVMLDKYLKEEIDIEAILSFIANRTYDTGLVNTVKMKYARDKYAI